MNKRVVPNTVAAILCPRGAQRPPSSRFQLQHHLFRQASLTTFTWTLIPCFFISLPLLVPSLNLFQAEKNLFFSIPLLIFFSLPLKCKPLLEVRGSARHRVAANKSMLNMHTPEGRSSHFQAPPFPVQPPGLAASFGSWTLPPAFATAQLWDLRFSIQSVRAVGPNHLRGPF